MNRPKWIDNLRGAKSNLSGGITKADSAVTTEAGDPVEHMEICLERIAQAKEYIEEAIDDYKERNRLEEVRLSGGKRANIGPGYIDNWWIGWGKDHSCQFEGTWDHMVELAAKILSHSNTSKTRPDLYLPDLFDKVNND